MMGKCSGHQANEAPTQAHTKSEAVLIQAAPLLRLLTSWFFESSMRVQQKPNLEVGPFSELAMCCVRLSHDAGLWPQAPTQPRDHEGE